MQMPSSQHRFSSSFLVKIEQRSGNLYGSSKDIGTISSRMPELSETGGRVNRVGFTRIERSGVISEYGFFTEFSEDSMTFDTDSDLYGHMSREMLTGANQITEDLLQIDLLSAAGTIVFGGTATSVGTITGHGADPSVINYADRATFSIAGSAASDELGLSSIQTGTGFGTKRSFTALHASRNRRPSSG